ncbi:MAG TPA: hypothetical protein DDY90_04900 [Clostridiales bacterium]|nr:hypothetical protein [Clostridiales bacterium]HBK26055.1 hypothetical protein [Clostridiales bacterium]HCP70545.1 hypothetical protein [Clostridiales bacterium]
MAQVTTLVMSAPRASCALAILRVCSGVRYCHVWEDIRTSPPFSWILNARIVKAKELLIGTSCLSISEIACACGFTNLYHFDRTFKVHTGCSPTEYLQTFGNNF